MYFKQAIPLTQIQTIKVCNHNIYFMEKNENNFNYDLNGFK